MPGVNSLENQNETATTALVAKRLRIQLKVAPRSQLRSGEFNQSAQLIGTYAVIIGVLLVALAFRLKKHTMVALRNAR